MSTALRSARFLGLFLLLSTRPLLSADDRPVAPKAEETTPLKAGDELPFLSLPDATGEDVKLSDLHAEGPLAIVFFRGSWCPLCTRHTQSLIAAHPDILELGAKLVAISPDSVENTKQNIDKSKIPFPVLSDAEVAAAKAFGLAFKVDDQTIARYRGFGIDLEKASGHDHHALPVPAVFIVNKSGKITFAHSNPDYTKRLDVKTILAEVKKSRGKKTE